MKNIKVVEGCDDNWENDEKIEFEKKEFTKMEIKKVTSIITEMDTIKKKIKKL